MKKCALPRSGKIVKLAPFMAEKTPLRSEGEQLEAFLRQLQKDQQVREIAGLETGFPNLSRALDGIHSGLHLLIGPPACGKTAFARQLLDQVARQNSVPGIFFSFADSEEELRIRTLARLSGIENREIRRGSAYLLHWYGVPKAHHTDVEGLPPSWEKLKSSAEEAKAWLDLIYLSECPREANLGWIEEQIREVETVKGRNRVMAVIDDCQHLGDSRQKLTDRVASVADALQRTAVNLAVPILAVWPDLREDHAPSPQIWSDRAPSADVILVMGIDFEQSKNFTEPKQAQTFHIVKNRSGERGSLRFEFYPAFSRFVEAG
jgi:replicative DNA helicase